MKEVKIINQTSPFFGKKGLATKHYEGFAGEGRPVIAVYFDGSCESNLFFGDEVEIVGNPTVYDAARLAYNQIKGKSFPVVSLVNRVRSICERPELMDGTILRRLRELREDGVVNFTCLDNHKAIYEKA